MSLSRGICGRFWRDSSARDRLRRWAGSGVSATPEESNKAAKASEDLNKSIPPLK